MSFWYHSTANKIEMQNRQKCAGYLQIWPGSKDSNWKVFCLFQWRNPLFLFKICLPVELPRHPRIIGPCPFVDGKTFGPRAGKLQAHVSDVKRLVQAQRQIHTALAEVLEVGRISELLQCDWLPPGVFVIVVEIREQRWGMGLMLQKDNV